MVCTKKNFLLSVSIISSTSHMMQLSLVPADYILRIFVCIDPSNSLSKTNEFIVFIFSVCLECFCSKNWKHYNASKLTGIFWRTLYMQFQTTQYSEQVRKNEGMSTVHLNMLPYSKGSHFC